MAADGSASCRFWILMVHKSIGALVAELTDDETRAHKLEGAGYTVIDRVKDPIPAWEPRSVA